MTGQEDMILFAFSKFKYVYCCYFYFMVLVYLEISHYSWEVNDKTLYHYQKFKHLTR